MALTKAELEEIKEAMKEAVLEHGCRFIGITDEEARHLSRVASVFTELGEGDLSQGVMEVRDNHVWLQKRRLELEPIYADNHAFVLGLRQGVCAAKTASIKVLIGFAVTAVLAGLVLLFKSGKVENLIIK